MALAYLTVSAAQSHLQLTGNSALLSRYISRAERWVDDLCNRALSGIQGFKQNSGTDYLDGTGTPDIVLPRTPAITSGMTVTILEGTTGSTTLSSTTYRLDGDTGILSRISGSWIAWDFGYAADEPTFPPGRRNIKVAYVGGFATIPETIKQATQELVSWLWHQRAGKRDPALQSENLGSYSYTLRGTAEDVQTSLTEPGGLLHNYVSKRGIC